MAALIDASVLIAVERGQLPLEVIAARYANDGVAIAAVTALELLHGVHRARTAAQRRRPGPRAICPGATPFTAFRALVP